MKDELEQVENRQNVFLLELSDPLAKDSLIQILWVS